MNTKKGEKKMIKEKLQELMEKITEEDDKEIVQDVCNNCARYVQRVVEMENSINLARFILEPEEYRRRIEDLDAARRSTHNVVITDMKVLNRLCKLYDLPAICTVDVTDRYAVANFAKVIVDELFENRRM